MTAISNAFCQTRRAMEYYLIAETMETLGRPHSLYLGWGDQALAKAAEARGFVLMKRDILAATADAGFMRNADYIRAVATDDRDADLVMRG